MNSSEDQHFTRIVVQVPVSLILRFRLLVESYEGVSAVRTVDKGAGLIALDFDPSFQPTVDEILRDLTPRFQVRRIR